jgi:hypothetical protein
MYLEFVGVRHLAFAARLALTGDAFVNIKFTVRFA